jgi:hypothetical protein
MRIQHELNVWVGGCQGLTQSTIQENPPPRVVQMHPPSMMTTRDSGTGRVVKPTRELDLKS